MNVYDFDKTIYVSDSTIDFYIFCIRRDFSLIHFLPTQIRGIILYKIGRYSKEEMKEKFFSFLLGVDNIDFVVEKFVASHQSKIYQWYAEVNEPTDVVISASPRFLIEEFSKKTFGFSVIATEVDKHTGEFLSPNCYGMEKVTRFRVQFSNENIEKFYSDSESDRPLAKLARKAYIIKRGKQIYWKV